MSDEESSGAFVSAIGFFFAMLIVGGALHIFGMTSFYGLWLGIFVGAVAMGISTWMLWNGGSSDDETLGNLSMYGAISVFSMIATSSWFWDSKGYCALQTETQRIEFGPQSLEDIFTNTSSYDFLVTDVSQRCMEIGAYDYANSYEIALLVGSSIFGILFILSLVVAFFASRDVIHDPTTKQNPVSELTIAKRIKIMEASLGNVKRCQELHGVLVNLDDFNKVRPPVKKCSDAQLDKIVDFYNELETEVSRVLSEGQLPTEPQQKKIDALAKKRGPVDRERAKRK